MNTGQVWIHLQMEKSGAPPMSSLRKLKPLFGVSLRDEGQVVQGVLYGSP